MRFWKYHGLGNVYVVVMAETVPSVGAIHAICDPHFGLSADGILVPQAGRDDAPFAVRIFNPDGSEAEKSGNGLRIFARYLHEQGLVGREPFDVWTAGGTVRCQLTADGRAVSVEMGPVRLLSRREPLAIDGERLHICAVSLGNPHCVVLDAPVDAATAQRIGPLIERHPRFPQRTNVQFMRVLDRRHLQIQIWERGAGYTLASGSSACAAAGVAHALGWCETEVQVVMPGGALAIALGDDLEARMTGPVTKIAEGVLADELFGAP